MKNEHIKIVGAGQIQVDSGKLLKTEEAQKQLDAARKIMRRCSLKQRSNDGHLKK